MDSGGGNTGSSDPAKTSTVETATNSLPGCGCSSANNITVRVTPTTGGQFDLQVAKTESVENFKKLISKKLKVPKERICLLHRDRQLRDGTLQENQLMDGSRLTLLPSVETGLLAQRPEQSVMQALESLNDTQVNDFLSGKAPLNLTMRLGDHMMLIQLQLSTVTPSSSRRSSAGSSNSSSTTTASASSSTSTSTTAPSPATAAAASPAPSPSASPSKSSLPSQLALASPSLSSVIASSPSLSSVIAAAAAAAAASASAASSGSSSAGGSNGGSSSSGLGDPTMTNSRTALSPSIPSSSGFAKAAAAVAASASSARPSSYTTATTTSAAEGASGALPASPAPCPSAATISSSTSSASPHPSPLKFLEEAASLLPKATSSTECPAAATTSTTSSPSFTSSSSSSQSSSSPPHTAQSSTSSSTSPASSSATPSTAAATGSSTHACAYGSGGSGCKCEAPAAKPMLDTRALAEASRNLTQTLKQLSSEVLTSRSDTAEDSPRGGRRQGAIIESMHHHGKGVYSGTFSGTLNPALQDRYGRPKRDISTIIHILNDLLCATPQYRRHTRQGHSISVEATGSTVPKKGTNPSDKNSSNLEYMEESGSLSRENQATRGKMEHLRLIMEERRARRRARREARAAPYTTQWSAKSESLPQSSAMGHDTVEPMETGEQSSSSASSEQQLCELNPPEPVVA